jgi:hypothetical protein
MNHDRWLSRFLLPWALLLASFGQPVRAQTPLTTIDMPQGGRIVYGRVSGADTQGAAMTAVLRNMHQSCGEKPQIGNVFKMRGTDSVGVFFTVVNHPAGNIAVAGLIIAAGSGPHEAEAALVTDKADRFGQTINPMLNKLFSVWRPGGAREIAGAAGGASPAAAAAAPTGGHPASVPPLHKVTLQDNTASVSIPDGWQLNPNIHGGTIVVSGPHDEGIVLNTSYQGVDPTNPGFRQAVRYGMKPMPTQVVSPYDVDLVKAFPDLYMRLAHTIHWNPTDLKIDHAEMLASPQNERCVQASGHVNNFGKGMMELNEILCLRAPDPNTGLYPFNAFFSLLPNAVADQQRATAAAVMASFQWDRALVQQRSDAEMAPILAQMRRNWDDQQNALIQRSQQITNQIRQTGASATARMKATEAANDEQHRAFNASQEDHDRRTQGFGNYLLDQTVIRDVQDPNTHATVWNRAADAWKKAYPDRIEEVPTSQYIKGQDF